MGALKWLSITALIVFAAYIISFYLRMNLFDKTYTHRPGKCRTFQMNGSEDIVLLSNKQALISSGFYVWAHHEKFKKPDPKIYMLDLNDKESSPVEVKFQKRYLEKNRLFTPHGMSHWENAKGEISLYVVTHWGDRADTIEVFQYFPDSVSLRHLKSISGDLIHNINDVVAVGDMEFYCNNDMYFSHATMRFLEVLLPINLNKVIYYNGATGELKPAFTGLKYPNGIAKSNNGRFIYVNHLLEGKVLAFSRNHDNSLSFAGSFQLMVAIDNIFVDPTNGHLWVGILPRPRDTTMYLSEDRSVAVPGRVVHIVMDETADDPFAEAKMEEVFATTGGEGELKATTIGVYHNHTLVVGTIVHNMMVCDVPYLIYGDE